MIKHETDITNSDIFIIGESVYSERFRVFLQEKGFNRITWVPDPERTEVVSMVRSHAEENGNICLVVYFIGKITEIKIIQKLTGINNCAVFPAVTRDCNDITLILLQKTDIKDLEEIPLNFETVFLKIEKLLIRLHMRIRIIASNKENREFFLKILRVMAKLLEERDEYTEHHSENVAKISCAIARKFDFTFEHLNKLEMAGLLHDFGKIGISDKILNKPSKLTDDEYETIKKHPSIAKVILEPVSNLEEMMPWITAHHERYDGKGYPDGLAGKDIPFEGRILGVADAYDTMQAKRTYHDPFPKEYIMNELVSNKGSQFDPEIVDVFLEILKEEDIELIT